MDLRLYAAVLWRFRKVVFIGLCIAVALAFLSMYSVGLSGISSRQVTTWRADSVLLVSQQGFPWGRSADELLPGNPQTGVPPRSAADTDRLTRLSVLYAQLASSDPVRRVLERSGPVRGRIEATPVFSFPNAAANATAFTLPLIRITARAASATGAITLSRRSAEALSTYITEQQIAAGVPERQRAEVLVIRRPRGAGAVSSGSSVLPAFVFLATLIGVLALVFVLENLRPATAERLGRTRPSGAPGSTPAAQPPVAAVPEETFTDLSAAPTRHASSDDREQSSDVVTSRWA